MNAFCERSNHLQHGAAVHTKVWRSWSRPFLARIFIPTSDYYGNVMGLADCGYRAVPRVEQTLSNYISPDAVSKGSVLALQAAAYIVSANGQGVGA